MLHSLYIYIYILIRNIKKVSLLLIYTKYVTYEGYSKVMPPVLLCWHKMSELDVGSMAVTVEPSHQYSFTCCCCVTDSNRGAVGQNGV